VRHAFGIAPLGARLEALLFQLFGGKVNRREQIGIRANADQLVIVIIDSGFRFVDLALQGKHDVSVALFLAIQQFADFGKSVLKLFQLRWSDFYLPTGVRDLH
jgi:hypothetical protein